MNKARGQFRRGTMNRTEEAYAQRLELLRRAGEIEWYLFEGWTFKLGADVRYTPDFALMLADKTLEAHEVKGFFREDAKVKLRVAASMFPVVFRLVRAKPKKLGGGWEVEAV